MSKSGFLLLWMVLLASSAFAHEEASRQSRTANAAPNEVTIEQRLNAQLPLDLLLKDESGQAFRLRDALNGKPALLSFVYYECPRLCPLILDGLVRSLRALSLPADQYQVIAVSIDPAETPAVAAQKKKQYMARYSRAAGWHFLTGEPSPVEHLTRAAGFRYTVQKNDGKDQYVHAAGTLVLTPDGRISRYLYGFDYPPKDLRFALIEASGNRIGSPVDRLLLLCYEYDPAKGKYTLAIMNILRLSGIATVVILSGFLIVMLCRERKRTLPSAGGSQ